MLLIWEGGTCRKSEKTDHHMDGWPVYSPTDEYLNTGLKNKFAQR
jgi:hypothetical protein